MWQAHNHLRSARRPLSCRWSLDDPPKNVKLHSGLSGQCSVCTIRPSNYLKSPLSPWERVRACPELDSGVRVIGQCRKFVGTANTSFEIVS